MSLVVNTNTASLIAQRNLNTNTNAITSSIERLSSGYKINKASDDAAGLSISEGLRCEIRGNEKAIANIQDGINMLQVAESALTSISDSAQRIRELTVQASNDTNGTAEKRAIISEINARLSDVNRISEATKFNGINLFSASNEEIDPYTGQKSDNYRPINLQIGAGSDPTTNVLDVANVLGRATTTHIGLGLTYKELGKEPPEGVSENAIADSMFKDGKLQVLERDENGNPTGNTIDADGSNWTGDEVRELMDKMDVVVSEIVQRRSNIGAYQNRLETALDNLIVTNENLTASESRIRDVDIAKETSNLTKYQILQQASASVLAQANQTPQLALSLIG